MKRNQKEKSFYHRLFILFIILVLPIFFMKEYRLIKAKKDTRILPTEDFFQAQLQPQEDKSFTFIVLTKDNVGSIERNFASIMKQQYPQFKVVYLDEGSTDGTTSHLKARIDEEKGQVSLIECSEEHEVFQKYYEVVNQCLDNEVIIHLHGSDWLAHDDVLSDLNQSYANPDVWLTYGQYLDYFNYKRGISAPKPKKTLYKKRVQRAPWVMAPFKTFYAFLFKKLQLDPSYFLSLQSDLSLLHPLAELGKAHVRFIPDIQCIRSQIHVKEQREHKLAFRAGKMIRSAFLAPKEKLADLVVFSENHPNLLETCIQSSQAHLKGVHRIHVIYDCNEENFAGYEKLQETFPKVNFIRLNYNAAGFKSSLITALLENSSSYVLLSTDHVSLNKDVSLSTCIEAMRHTQAYGFYFHLGRKDSEFFEGNNVPENIYKWNFRKTEGSYAKPDALKMALYRRLDLEKELKALSFSSVDELINAWARIPFSYRLGLSFEEPKTICHHDYKQTPS